MVNLIKRHQLATAGLLLFILVTILYWPSLALPVLYDDLLHIRIVKGLNLWTVWMPAEQFGFYRPLTFFPLILIKKAFGYYPNWLLHGLNVLQHGFNAMLLVALCWRLGQPHRRAIVAGLLFAFFPFSYQAIAVYGHNVHPTITGLFLAGLHTYLTAVRLEDDPEKSSGRRRRFWWVVTGFLFLLSLFSHESAILFGAFAALLHWNEKGGLPALRSTRQWFQVRRFPPWLIFLLLGFIYFVGYQFLPISRAPQAVSEGGGWWLRVLYLLQAAGYPFTWFAHRLPSLDAVTLILIGSAITLVLSIWTARQCRARLPLLLAWGWWALSSLLIAIPLPTNYLLHGPRLLYLSSVGLALLWSHLLVDPRYSSLRKGLSWLLISFILMSNWQFVRDRLAQYTRLTQPIAVIADVMAPRPAGEGIVTVNLPQWIAPPRNRFALGAELVAMLGNHLFADEIIAENLPGARAVYPVVVPDLLGKPDYPYGIHDETLFRGDAAASLPIRSDWTAEGSQLFIVEYVAEGPRTRHTGSFQRLEDPQTSPQASFYSYDLLKGSGVFCNGVVQVELLWKPASDETISPTLSMFVQLLSADGRLIAQADGPPLGLRTDLVQLQPGWAIRDLRSMRPAPADQPSQLLIGVYDFVSGDRLAAVDNQKTALPDNAFRLPVTDCPDPD